MFCISASWVLFVPDFDPIGTAGNNWLKAVRREIDSFQNDTGFRVHFSGLPGDAFDAIDSVIVLLSNRVLCTCWIILMVF